MVFRFAIAEGLARRDPTVDLSHALAPAKPVEHMASLRGGRLPTSSSVSATTTAPSRRGWRSNWCCTPWSGPRTCAERRWSEVGREQWRIPAERMKMSLEHIVPLTPTSRRLFERLRELSGGSRLIVPGEKPGKPISQNTMIYALYRMGYHGRLTIHGFRRTASTILNESGLWEPDWIERQLAHVEVNKVRARLQRRPVPRAPDPHDAVVVGLSGCAQGHQRVAGIANVTASPNLRWRANYSSPTRQNAAG